MAEKARVARIVVGQEEIVRSYSVYTIKYSCGGGKTRKITITNERDMGFAARMIEAYSRERRAGRYEIRKGKRVVRRENRGVSLDEAVKMLRKEIEKKQEEGTINLKTRFYWIFYGYKNNQQDWNFYYSYYYNYIICNLWLEIAGA